VTYHAINISDEVTFRAINNSEKVTNNDIDKATYQWQWQGDFSCFMSDIIMFATQHCSEWDLKDSIICKKLINT